MKIIVTAGGTAGHLLPAQKLADQFIKDKNRVIFVGKGLKNNYNFKKDKYIYKNISSGAFNKKKFFFSIFSIFKGFLQSIFILYKIKPDVVVGFGSFHTFPILMASVLLKKPIVLFEANIFLGKVNRFFAKHAHAIALQFKNDKIKKYKNIEMVNIWPWEEKKIYEDKEVYKKKIGLKKMFTIFIFGGSLGADFFNKKIIDIVALLKKKKMFFQIIHLTGKGKIVKKKYEDLNIFHLTKDYEENIEKFFLASDLCICRAGAGTICELIHYEIPSILIPYPYASENHQKMNADFFCKEIKGGYVFSQEKIDVLNFSEKIYELMMQEDKMEKIKKNLRTFKKKQMRENRKHLLDIVYKVGSKI